MPWRDLKKYIDAEIKACTAGIETCMRLPQKPTEDATYNMLLGELTELNRIKNFIAEVIGYAETN